MLREPREIPTATVPERCLAPVLRYRQGDHYASDTNVVAMDSLAFATQALAVEVQGVMKPAWVFDIDETLLSNEPYYAVDPSSDRGLQELNANSRTVIYLVYSIVLGYEIYNLSFLGQPMRGLQHLIFLLLYLHNLSLFSVLDDVCVSI